MTKSYFPDITASGSLIMNLIPYFRQTLKVEILTCGQSRKMDNDEGIVRFSSYSGTGLSEKILNRLQKKRIKINNAMKDYLVKKLEDSERILLMPITMEEFALAVELKKENVNKVFLFPFLLENLLVGYDRRLTNRLKKELEEYSDIIFVLPKLKKYFSDKNSAKIVVVEHPMVRDKTNASTRNLDKIIYAGGLDKKNRNPQKIIEAFLKLKSNNMTMMFYSYGNCQRYLASISSVYKNIVSRGSVDSEQAMIELTNAGFIITIGNKNPSLVPSKIFDCISTGNPIIHFYYSDQDPYIHYLKSYDYSLCCNINDINIEKLNLFLIAHRGKKLKFTDIDKRFHYATPQYVFEQMIKNIRSVLL